jgi:antitoxin (DNA-binding transcriptional repressor) of toxin-antitoxin stability system
MVVNVSLRSIDRVPLRTRHPRDMNPPQPLHPFGDEGLHLAGEQAEHPGELLMVTVAGIPVARLVGLTEPDEPVRAKAPVEGPRPMQPEHRRVHLPIDPDPAFVRTVTFIDGTGIIGRRARSGRLDVLDAEIELACRPPHERAGDRRLDLAERPPGDPGDIRPTLGIRRRMFVDASD